LFKEVESSITVDYYLSFRPKEGEATDSEKLHEHLKSTVLCSLALNDHVNVVSKLIRALAAGTQKNVSQYNDASMILLTFTALYHDIGKAELHYQFYAHNRVNEYEVPHNMASIAFLLHALNNEELYEKWIKLFVEELGFRPGIAVDLLTASLTAVVLHHEYFDYRDLSFIDIVTPTTIAYAKRVNINTLLCFHKSVANVVDYAWSNIEKLNSDKNIIIKLFTPLLYRPKSNVVIVLGEALDYISTLHHELGGIYFDTKAKSLRVKPRENLHLVLSLAEVLTWILTVADNLAASKRGDKGSVFSKHILRYYGVQI